MTTAQNSIRVLLADDAPLLRRSLRIAIDREPDLTVIAEAATGEEAIAHTLSLRPDIVMMDIRMPDGDGIHATKQITGIPDVAETRIIMLTMFELDEYVYGALAAGASAFLLKDAHPAQLVDAIRRVHAGESLFAPTVLTTLIDHYLQPHKQKRIPRIITGLTPRETEVLALVGQGLANDEIAEALTITGHTVKSHVSHLLTKLHARDRAQLVIAAYDNGLSTSPNADRTTVQDTR